SASVLGRPCWAARAAPISTDQRCLDYRRGSMMHTPGAAQTSGIGDLGGDGPRDGGGLGAGRSGERRIARLDVEIVEQHAVAVRQEAAGERGVALPAALDDLAPLLGRKE